MREKSLTNEPTICMKEAASFFGMSARLFRRRWPHSYADKIRAVEDRRGMRLSLFDTIKAAYPMLKNEEVARLGIEFFGRRQEKKRNARLNGEKSKDGGSTI